MELFKPVDQVPFKMYKKRGSLVVEEFLKSPHRVVLVNSVGYVSPDSLYSSLRDCIGKRSLKNIKVVRRGNDVYLVKIGEGKEGREDKDV